ncbi:hypothetical protein NT6N_11910 [Oceaniferula spumae]|uniref:Peptide-methionine (S)-S-oxide reductase n=1 Tax=Oceaniferula spumae TaxID=2979115 RepID=A0AAT9FJM0_9BACT
MHRKIKTLLLLGLLVIGFLPLLSLCSNSMATVETGPAEFLRDHDTAMELAKKSGKPVFAFFQEVPGCAGCQKFGKEVMTDTIIMDAVENNFVPLLIHNNKGGKDAEILKKYKEPAWNYQVIRFLDSKGRDIIPRKDQVNTRAELSQRMADALVKAKKPVPKALQLLQLSTDTRNLEKVAFSCHCFWTGEAKLGTLDGVVETEAGFFDGHEVTLVTYHKKTISLRELVRQAQKFNVANSVYVTTTSQIKEIGGLVKNPKTLGKDYRKAKASDQNRQIPGTAFAQLKLSPAQACKVNAFCRTQPKKALEYLTVKQRQKIAR